MSFCRALLPLLFAWSAALGSTAVLAQSTGKSRYEPAPAPAAAADPLRYMPPPRPSDYLGYMSAECASMHDGLRTAPSRGRSTTSQAELRAEYLRRCAADESQARRRWAGEQRNARAQESEQQFRAREEAERQQAQQSQQLEQCREMKRIIDGKNARLSQLTPGEVADLRRFEGNFASRCPMLAR